LTPDSIYSDTVSTAAEQPMTDKAEHRCDECDAVASVRAVIIINGDKRVVRLCDGCAAKTQFLIDAHGGISPLLIEQLTAASTDSLGALAKADCPDCGTKFMDFRNKGRLGCPNDYVVFRGGLLPLMARVHRAVRHVGKRPRRNESGLESSGEIRKLRRAVREAISAERYEEAARLRDEIKSKEDRHAVR
jgi:protein arginine kinase activator